jgi:hypothetical protein
MAVTAQELYGVSSHLNLNPCRMKLSVVSTGIEDVMCNCLCGTLRESGVDTELHCTSKLVPFFPRPPSHGSGYRPDRRQPIHPLQ